MKPKPRRDITPSASLHELDELFGSSVDLFGSPDALSFDAPAVDLFDEGVGGPDPGANEPQDEEIPGEKLPRLRTAFEQRTQREHDRFHDAVDSEFWVAFCFQTRAQKEEFLLKLGILESLDADKYVDGLEAARVLGVKIESPSPVWREAKASKRLSDLT